MKKILEHFNLYPTSKDYQTWLISYVLINLTFLYHSLNFMWGNHDVEFIKNKLSLTSGLFEGRFTQFIPYCLLTDGQILPIINNLLGFAFLTIALWLLAKYWRLPQNTLTTVLFITFFATLPYTLSWLYFTFITISCLVWVFFIILGLYFSSYIYREKHKLALTLFATLCFYLPLGGYPPVINTIFVCLCAEITITYAYCKTSIKEIIKIHKYTLLNILLAAILFKLTLWYIQPENVYNLETTPLLEIPQKILSVIKISFQQFILSLPYMEKNYKLMLCVLLIISFTTILICSPDTKHRLIITVLIFITILSAAATTLLVTPHTEYVARIDFYGLAFIYLFAAAILIHAKPPLAKSIFLIFMLILIPWNIINDYRAQKNWQQGFDAEFQILADISERIENHPQFNPNRTYKFYQIGDISLRHNYYQNHYEYPEPFLLSLPYLAMWQGANLIQYYSPYNFIDKNQYIQPSDITPEVYNFIMQQAQPWPHQNSVYINNQIILVIYNHAGLTDFRKKIAPLQQ